MKTFSSLFLFSGTGAGLYLGDPLFWGFLIPTIILAVIGIFLSLYEREG
jgi:hypothetical protein